MTRAKQAKKILPKGEFEHFEAVIQNQISRTPESSLKKKATVSRRLRDKYRDLARRQVASAKKKRTNDLGDKQNEARAEIFQELIGRIETELERPRRKAATKKAATGGAKPSPRAKRRLEKSAAREHRNEKLMRDAKKR